MPARSHTQLDLSGEPHRALRRNAAATPMSTRKRVLLIDYQSWLALTDDVAKAAASRGPAPGPSISARSARS